jgi:hypothetical protein
MKTDISLQEFVDYTQNLLEQLAAVQTILAQNICRLDLQADMHIRATLEGSIKGLLEQGWRPEQLAHVSRLLSTLEDTQPPTPPTPRLRVVPTNR